MFVRLLTAFTLGSLFLTLNLASMGCIGGAGLNPSQLPGGLGLSGANGDSSSGKDKNKENSESDGNGGSDSSLPPGDAGTAGSGGGGGENGGGGGGGSGDDNVAKGTANFQPFETGMGEDKEPKPHENAENEDPNQNPGDQGETLENQGCEPNCGGEIPHHQYLSRPTDFNHLSNISPVLVAPTPNGQVNFH